VKSVRVALAGLFHDPIGLFANNGLDTDPNGRPLAPPQGTFPGGGQASHTHTQ